MQPWWAYFFQKRTPNLWTVGCIISSSEHGNWLVSKTNTDKWNTWFTSLPDLEKLLSQHNNLFSFCLITKTRRIMEWEWCPGAWVVIVRGLIIPAPDSNRLGCTAWESKVIRHRCVYRSLFVFNIFLHSISGLNS